jgi:hypothetical protein
MLHVQNWKIYASHYNDDSTELGVELRKAQLHYKQYGEQMGVPVTDDIVSRAKRPSVDDIFPFCLMELLCMITIKHNLLKGIIIASQSGSGKKGKGH